MTIYIDSDYKCHTSSGDGFTPVETDTFDGKCRQYIEGYRSFGAELDTGGRSDVPRRDGGTLAEL